MRKDLKPIEVAYRNLERLGPWGEQSVIYSMFQADDPLKKTNSKQFKSVDCSPRKTYSKDLPMMQTQTVSPKRREEGSFADNQPQIPRTNVEDYFNRKPDRKLNTVSKKMTQTKTISNFKSLPLLKVRKELEIERKIYVMNSRQVQSGQQSRLRTLSKKSVVEKDMPLQRRGSDSQAPSRKLRETEHAGKNYFVSHFNRMLKIIDEMSRQEPVWVTSRRHGDLNNL